MTEPTPHKMREIRIQSDGFGYNSIVTLEDGSQLKPIRAYITIEAGDVNRVDLEFIHTPADVHAHIREVTMCCPLCGFSDSHQCGGKPIS